MPSNPTPAEGVVVPLDPDFAEALIEKLTEIATRDDLKGRHVVFNTEVRSIATIVGVAAKVIGRPLAARPAAPTQSAAQTGEVDAILIEAQAAEIEGLRKALERINTTRLRTHSQKSTTAARAMADRKTVGHRS